MPSCTGDFCFIFSWNVVALQCSVSFRGTNQPHEYIYSLLLGFPFHLGQRVTFCLLIQMLISSENSPTDTPRNYVLLEIQASFSPVRLGLKNKIKLYRWGTGGCWPSSLLHPGDWPVSMGIFFSRFCEHLWTLKTTRVGDAWSRYSAEADEEQLPVCWSRRSGSCLAGRSAGLWREKGWWIEGGSLPAMACWPDHHSQALIDCLLSTGTALGWVMNELP